MIKCTWEIGIEEYPSQTFEIGRDRGKTYEKFGGFFFCFLQARLFCDFSASSPEAVLAQGGVAIAGTGDESFSAVEGVRLREYDEALDFAAVVVVVVVVMDVEMCLRREHCSARFCQK